MGPDPAPPPFKNHKNRVSKHYWSRSPEKSQATKPAFNVGPLSARQRNAFRWRADDGPPIVVFDPPYPHQLKKVKVGPPLT